MWDDDDIDLFFIRVVNHFSVDELCERMHIETEDLVERFREEIIREGYSIFDD